MKLAATLAIGSALLPAMAVAQQPSDVCGANLLACPNSTFKGGNITLGNLVPPEARWITFGVNGPSINPTTGEVRIPKGMAPDEAARTFWDSVAGITGHKPEYIR